MSMPFDATMKELAEDSPVDFLVRFDEPPTAPVSVLNVDLSTVTASTDIVYGLGDPLEVVVHIDFQASANADKHRDVFAYHALLHRAYKVPVHTIVLVLRAQGGHSNMDGVIAYAPRPGRGNMNFGYEIINLWERPAEEFLTGGLGTLPLAPLGQLPEGVTLEEGLASVVQHVIERLRREAPEEKVHKLLTASYFLTGMRVKRTVAQRLFRGVQAMHESDTYQAVLDEGRLEEAQNLILKIGAIKFGPPNETVKSILAGLVEREELDRLRHLATRTVTVTSWSELLEGP